MRNKIYYILLFVVVSIVCSCKNDFTDAISPSERNANNIAELRRELTEAEYGWRMVYFSKTDSLLFSNKSQILADIKPDFDYVKEKYFGYGGHYFIMKFNKNGTVKMKADYDVLAVESERESEFEINQNTFTQLSFTTYNYLHKLVNKKFGGVSDFLFVGKDFKGDLVFKTSSYMEPAREFIIFQKLNDELSWDNDLKASYENRTFFYNMRNPQLTIRKGDRIYYKSDRDVKNPNRFNYEQFLDRIRSQRYYLFEQKTQQDHESEINGYRTIGLGSGYVGTEKGLSFYSGIRYDSNNIFYDFERRGDKFVCELVKIYDPMRKFMYVSKHLFPDGEPTYMVAEIYDAK